MLSNVNAAELENVRMQLRWHHQYQFAGYYVAKHKGFYEEAGFNVEIVAGGPNKQPVYEVLSGRADFAGGNSEVLINQLQGKPLVGLAAIFQHSPSILLTLASSGITKAEQLKNKKVMLIGSNDDADLIAMFRAVGVSEDQVDIHKSSYNINDLIHGNTLAFNSYRTNEPFFLEEKGVEYNLISPQDYGIDFYSDILFTTEARVKKDPKSVQRFKEASIKGWQYAIEHSEEVIQIIVEHYSQTKSLNHIRFEALAVNSLVKSELLPIGHIFPQRLEKMADAFIAQNMVSNKDRLAKFMFVPPKPINSETLIWLISAALITLLSITIVIYISKMNWQLKKEIQSRLAAEQQLQFLADTDSLTKLLNRRAFIRQYQEQKAMAVRYNQPFCVVLLDLDFFKKINDNYGHDMGDKVLIKATQILTETLRDVDICARFGGEEFIALLPNTTIDEAKVTVERVRENFANTILTFGEEEVRFTASFAIIQWEHSQLDDLLIEVDKALYRAKDKGRNNVETV